MKNFEELTSAVIAGQADKVKELTQKGIDEEADLNLLINEGLIVGMAVVGQRFKSGEMFVPDMMLAARAMSGGMGLLKPLLGEGSDSSKGTIILGTVKGDLHDIGKNLVGMMVEGAGFKVIDIGIDQGADQFLAAVKEHDAQVVAMSALLTTTMPSMKETVEVFEREGLRNKVKIIVGGAPLSQDFSDEIGADGYASDAASASELIGSLIG